MNRIIFVILICLSLQACALASSASRKSMVGTRPPETSLSIRETIKEAVQPAKAPDNGLAVMSEFMATMAILKSQVAR